MKVLVGMALGVAALTGVANRAWAMVELPDNASIRTSTLGLELAGKVELAGSDSRSETFQKEVLPEIQKIVNLNLAERVSMGKVETFALDPKQLALSYASNVRVYFVGEGAGYQNSLGFYTTEYSQQMGIGATDAKIIFPNASSNSSYMGESDVWRTPSNPLLSGDFVDLGTQTAGTQLSYFLVSNGNQGGRSVLTTDPTNNPDKLQHVVSFAMAVANSPYLILGFEDMLGGGDKDYNDVVIAVDIGRINVAQLMGTAVPLPTPIWAALAPAGWMVYSGIRRRMAKKNVTNM
jgi:hypothetical protein